MNTLILSLTYINYQTCHNYFKGSIFKKCIDVIRKGK